MEVRNCRSCRRLFNYLGGPNICPACRDALELKFVQVRDFIKDNPTKNLQEIADAHEISVNQIRDWVKEGRLEIVKGGGISLQCEKCGAAITRGRYCDNCKKSMVNDISNAFEDTRRNVAARNSAKNSDPNSSHGMRFKRMD